MSNTKMQQNVAKKLDAQLERMTLAMRKKGAGGDGTRNGNSTEKEDFEQYINARHFLAACRASFVHYYRALLVGDDDTCVTMSDVYRSFRRREKYEYACDYLSEKMEKARIQCMSGTFEEGW